MRHTVARSVVGSGRLALGAASPPRPRSAGFRSTTCGVPRGIGIYGDVGFPNDDAGSGTAYGADRPRGLRRPRRHRPCSPPRSRGAGDADVSRRRHAQLPGVRRAAGAAVGDAAGRRRATPSRRAGRRAAGAATSPAYHFPIGVGFALAIPNPSLGDPSLARAPGGRRAPRRPSGESTTETNFGLSGGLELNLLNGFGLQAAYDRVFAERRPTPATFGVGAHYAFRVPGL